jgi:hypothetical protein
LTGLFWVGRYQVGLHYMLNYNNKSRSERLMYHLGLLILTPFVELMCTVPTLMALIEPPEGFEITGKISNSKEGNEQKYLID